MQQEKKLKGEKIESMNFVSYQISRKIAKGKNGAKAKRKKILAMASDEAINKVVRYFYKRNRH